MPEDGGGLFFDVATSGKITLTNNKFEKGVVFLWSSPKDLVFDINNNTFKGERSNGWFSKYCIVDTNNGNVSPAGATINVTNNSFTDMKSVSDDNYARIRGNVGTMTLSGNRFPTADGVYWIANSIGTVIVNGVQQLLNVSTTQELRTAMVNPNVVGVILNADVEWESSNPSNGAADNQDAFTVGKNDVSGMEYYDKRPMDGFILDGNGKTMRGVAYNNILAIYANNVTVKNLTIEQTDAQKTTRINGGLSVYRSNNALIENVTIKNCGKAGMGINACIAKAVKVTTIGNAWGGVDVTKGGAPAGGNRPVFTFDSTCDFQEDTQLYVSTDRTGTDYTVNAPSGWKSRVITGKVIYTNR